MVKAIIGLGAMLFWCTGLEAGRVHWTEEGVVTALCHGYAFGVCYVLGSHLMRERR